MWKELESNSGPLSRSYGLEMIGFPILYWGVLHDESSLHSKSTPIKTGLFIPLWDMLWMFAWNKHFHPLSLFTSNTVAFAGISIMCACVFVSARASSCTVGFVFVSGLRIHILFAHRCMCVCITRVDMLARACPHVTQCLLCSPALFVPAASGL